MMIIFMSFHQMCDNKDSSNICLHYLEAALISVSVYMSPVLISRIIINAILGIVQREKLLSVKIIYIFVN